MAQFLTIAKIVLSLFPAIIEAVRAIEAALPQGGAGTAKLDAVRTTLQGAYSIAQNAEVQFENVWPAISAAVGAAVTLFNSTGLFKKA